MLLIMWITGWGGITFDLAVLTGERFGTGWEYAMLPFAIMVSFVGGSLIVKSGKSR